MVFSRGSSQLLLPLRALSFQHHHHNHYAFSSTTIVSSAASLLIRPLLGRTISSTSKPKESIVAQLHVIDSVNYPGGIAKTIYVKCMSRFNDSWLHFSINHKTRLLDINSITRGNKEDTGTSNHLLTFFAFFYCDASHFLFIYPAIPEEEGILLFLLPGCPIHIYTFRISHLVS